MKKIFYNFSFMLVALSSGWAEESKSYCEKNCSPTYCAAHPLQGAICKDACPAAFKKCFEAIPPAARSEVNKAIEKIRTGFAAAETH